MYMYSSYFIIKCSHLCLLKPSLYLLKPLMMISYSSHNSLTTAGDEVQCYREEVIAVFKSMSSPLVK